MIVLVTGANGGLGRAIAGEFLKESADHHVFLGVRENRDRADELAAEFDGRSEVVSLDVTDAEAWSLTIEAIIATHGRIDVLVNNAGFHRDHLLATMPLEDWDAVISANLDAVFHGCRAVIKPMMSQRFGRIVNIASLSALLAPAGQTNYAAAKAGVIALTQSLAKEAARAGITVNAICPGYVETEALSGLDDGRKRDLAKQIPMRRFGKPEEVAAAVKFLASQAAGYITGAVLKIDGGIF